MSNDNRLRRQKNEETQKTATSHRLPWGSDEDTLIMEHNYVNGTLEVAYMLGRTFEAVEQRRYILQVRLAAYKPTPPVKPLTLQDACNERTKQLTAGVTSPTIMQVPGGYKVVQGVKEV